MEPGQLSATFVDCHIYVSHLEQIKEQLIRVPMNLPSVKLSRWNGIFDWRAEDASFPGYRPHGRIKAEVAV
jgi:thymidylate synthase